MTIRRVAAFWAPLAVMWLLMAVEKPLLAAVIARLPDPERNLGAFEITFSLALLVESPVIMLLTAATALASARQPYRRLVAFTSVMAVGLTALHVLIAVTPLYDMVVGGLIGAPAELVEPGRQSFLWMSAWTSAIAFRRLWQGVLIRHDQTRRAMWPTTVRLVLTAAVGAAGLAGGFLSGASLGGLALSLGVVAAAMSAYLLARPTVRDHLTQIESFDVQLTWRRLGTFYAPLALTSFIVLGGGPIVTFGLSRTSDALTALAVWPVVTGILFVVRSGGNAYQEVVVALSERPGAAAPMRRFAWLLATTLTAALAVFAFSPLGPLWLSTASALQPPLVAATLPAIALCVPIPGLSVLVSWLRGRLVHAAATTSVTMAVAVNIAVLILTMVVAPWYRPQIPGAQLGGLALSLALAAETLALTVAVRRAESVASRALSRPAVSGAG